MAESTSRHRARRGDGTIYTTKDGRLRAAVTVPDALTGEPSAATSRRGPTPRSSAS